MTFFSELHQLSTILLRYRGLNKAICLHLVQNWWLVEISRSDLRVNTVIIAKWRHSHAGHARERIFPKEISLFDFTVTRIIHRYRLPAHTILAIPDDIKDDIEPATQRFHTLPCLVKLLSAVLAPFRHLSQLPLGNHNYPSAAPCGMLHVTEQWMVQPSPKLTANWREKTRIFLMFLFPQCCGHHWLYRKSSST